MKSPTSISPSIPQALESLLGPTLQPMSCWEASLHYHAGPNPNRWRRRRRRHGWWWSSNAWSPREIVAASRTVCEIWTSTCATIEFLLHAEHLWGLSFTNADVFPWCGRIRKEMMCSARGTSVFEIWACLLRLLCFCRFPISVHPAGN